MALKDANIKYEIVGFSEIDKYASTAYKAVHGNVKNYGDITKINPTQLPDFDFFTYSFPCQSISVSGKQKGLKKDSGTRSSLLWECEKIIKAKRPKYLLMENVKNLIGVKFKKDFLVWVDVLRKLGYVSYVKVLNAKHHGIPQNRERVFMISILGGGEFEFPNKKDLKIKLKDVLEDEVDEKYYLKKEVCDRFTAFSNDRMKDGINVLGTTAPNPKDEKGNIIYDKATRNWVNGTDGIVGTLSATDYKQPKQIAIGDLFSEEPKENNKDLALGFAQRGRNPENPTSRKVGLDTEQMLECNNEEVSNCLTSVQKDSLVGLKVKQVGNIVDTGNFKNPQRGRIYSKEGLSPCLNTVSGGGLEPKIFESTNKVRTLFNTHPSGKGMNGKVFDSETISPTLTTNKGDGLKIAVKEATKKGYSIAEEGDSINLDIPNSKTRRGRVGKEVAQTLTCSCNQGTLENFRIRKLTPLECFRLMGVKDEDFNKIKAALIQEHYNGVDRANSQLYKMAGNSIVTNCLSDIYLNLFKDFFE